MRTSDRTEMRDRGRMHDALCLLARHEAPERLKAALFEVYPERSLDLLQSQSVEVEAPLWSVWPGRVQGGSTRTLPSAWVDLVWRARFRRKQDTATGVPVIFDEVVFAEVKTKLRDMGEVLRQMKLYRHLLGPRSIGVLAAPYEEILAIDEAGWLDELEAQHFRAWSLYSADDERPQKPEPEIPQGLSPELRAAYPDVARLISTR